MKRSRRIEVTVERDRVLVVRPGSDEKTWCPVCQADTQMVSVDEAALWLGVTSRTIFQWVNEGRAHSVEMANGLLRICINSLGWSG